MGQQINQTLIARFPGIERRKSCIVGAVLFFLLIAPQAGLARCKEKPTAWMNERTAASHLLSSRKFVFPAVLPVLAHVRSVEVLVTVDRTGGVCEAKAETGPTELRAAAEKIVRTYWRYRPFLLDWKPVVVQMPVTVNFVISADRKDSHIPRIAGAGRLLQLPGKSLPSGPGAETP